MQRFIPEVSMVSFDYNLPQSFIAEYPLEKRDESKLLIYNKGVITDDVFKNIDAHLPGHSTLVLNDSKVIAARILFTKPTGGIIEIFCLQPHDPAEMEQALNQTSRVIWRCMIGGASKWKPKQLLRKTLYPDMQVELVARFLGKLEDAFIIEFTWSTGHVFAEILEAAGVMPLPPYIKRNTEELDKERYQTIFAAHKGSVAAPTAALHFTPEVFDKLSLKNIRFTYTTLHVSAGTFKPVKSNSIEEHNMHAENFTVSINTLKQLIAGKEIFAVGTTSLRTLESLYWMGVKLKNGNALNQLSLSQWEPYQMENFNIPFNESLQILLEHLENHKAESVTCTTSLLIVPGYRFKSAKGLITNFHQPKSTLLLLVAAFIGDDWKKVYNHALEHNYRFLSYGDSSLLWRS